jgi:hypothetical protein
MALYALHHDIAPPETHSLEPMLRAIRVQWWQETLETTRNDGTITAHPLLPVLKPLISAEIPWSHWQAWLDAHHNNEPVAASATLAILALLLMKPQATPKTISHARQTGAAFALTIQGQKKEAKTILASLPKKTGLPQPLTAQAIIAAHPPKHQRLGTGLLLRLLWAGIRP